MTTTQISRWQQIVRDRNLDVSVVEIKDLADNFRLDAEYYKPFFVVAENRIKNQNWDFLYNVSSKITDFGAYSQNNFVEYQETGEVFFIRNQNVEEFFIKNDDPIYISSDTYDKLSLHLECGDILVQRVGSLGKSSIVLDQNLPSTANQNLAQIKPNKTNSFYLITFLNSKYGQFNFERLQTGNVQPWLNLQQIKNLKIPLPSSAFQKNIASLVQSAHTAREKSKTLYREAEEILLAELGLKNWKPTEKNWSVKDACEAEQAGRMDAEYFQPKYDELFAKIAKHEIKNLSEICRIKRGSLISPKFYNENNGIPYLRGADFSSGNLEDTKLVFIDSIFEQKNEQTVKTGDIIFASIGSVGTSALVDEKFDGAFLSNNTAKLEIKNRKELLPIFLQMILQSIVGQMQFEQMETRTAQPKISNDQIGMIQIPILDSKLQTQISEKITASHIAREESKTFLEKAKRAVEIFIEKDEKQADKFLKS